jgi:hypothetical protein
MTFINNRIFLYAGLSLLLIALIIRVVWWDSIVWLLVFCSAILLKILFLILSLRKNKLKLSLWLTFILAGVVLIFTSMFFKYVIPIIWFRNILFYGAIALKLTGLVLMTVEKNRSR